MTDAAILLMPFPISVNGIWRSFRKSPRYRAWITEADFQAVKQKPLPVFYGPVGVMINLGRPDNRKRDIDNLAKGILDRLEAWQVIEDDSLVHRLTLQWSVNVVGTQVEIISLKARAA